jgi:predicted metal-dependent peptidase
MTSLRQTQGNARERIQQVAEQWFLTEPVFFAVYCSHRLAMNANMQCPLRTGQGRIEYNPTVIDALQDNQLNEMLKVEMIRILLQHPYARQPLGCKPLVQHAASDMVISPAYKLAWIELTKPEDFGLPMGQHYEWYATRLNDMTIHVDGNAPSEGDSGGSGDAGGGGKGSDSQQEQSGQDTSSERSKENGQGVEKGQSSGLGTGKMKGSDTGQGNASGEARMSETDYGKNNSKTQAEGDYTALWEEDQFQSRLITDLIQSTTSWGSMPGGMIELIKKAAEGKIDFRSALRGFRASILSEKRRLTRMRPSRRFGFEQMGSRYDFITRILVAVDTSGSVGSEELGRYFNVITTFFKYGIQQVDVLMFDACVQGDVMKLDEAKKRKQEFKVQGRGGTNFQAPVDYLAKHPEYDGMIVITDGYAPVPEIPPHCRAKLLWIIDNEASYQRNGKALRKTGRVCLMQV